MEPSNHLAGASTFICGIGDCKNDLWNFRAFNPAAIGMLADSFPSEQLPIANSVYTFGIFFGGGLSSSLGGSLSDIESFGWRWTFGVFGIFGILISILLFLTIREPRRGNYTVQEKGLLFQKLNYKEAIRYMVNVNSIWKFYFFAGIRILGGITFGAFVPPFFKDSYPNYSDQVNVWYGLIVMGGGFLSSFLGGLFTHLWSKRNQNAPLWVSALGALFSCPFVGIMMYAQVIMEEEKSALNLALAALFFSYITAELWGGPAYVIIQSLIPSRMQGTGFACYFGVAFSIGGAGPVLVGFLLDRFCSDQQTGCSDLLDGNLEKNTILGAILFSYILSGGGFIWTTKDFIQDSQIKIQVENGEREVKPVSFDRALLAYVAFASLIAWISAFVILSFF